MNKEIVNNVNHPQHYENASVKVEKTYEPYDLCNLYNFYIGNVLKYLCRAKYKGHYVEDLAKAQWYLRREYEVLEKNNKQRTELHELFISKDMISAFRNANSFIKDLIDDYGSYSCYSIQKVLLELENEISKLDKEASC